MLTKSKEEIALEVRYAVLRAMKDNPDVGYNMPYNSIMNKLTELIALAVQAGVAEMLKHQYTNEEFERDVGLDKA